MAYAEVFGHERVKRLLAHAVASGRVPSALLFSGPEGVGKRTLALAFARALLCTAGGDEACGRCAACRRSGRGLHPDLVVVVPDGASIKIDQVRDTVREIGSRPFEAPARAFVIDDAHLMTEQAANALLKSLEEPPPTSHVVLVTGSPQALLPTIRSRCQVLRFGPLPLGSLAARLVEQGMGEEEARLRASFSGGSLGAALAFDAPQFFAVREECLKLVEQGARMGPAERLQMAETLADSDDPILALTALRALLRDVAALAAGAGADVVLNADLHDRLAALAAGPLAGQASVLAEAVGDTRDYMEGKVPGQPLKQGASSKVLALDVLLDAFARHLGLAAAAR